MSWKPEVLIANKWSKNDLVFETEQEAQENARDKFMGWTMCDGHRAVESADPVNATYQNGKLEMLPTGEQKSC